MNPDAKIKVFGQGAFALRHAVVLLAGISVSACNLADSKMEQKAELDTAPKVTEAEVGVPASPRVTESRKVAKGGGRYQVGKPYKVRGKWYVPTDDPTYAATGHASWYGANFHGRQTANGELFDQYSFSAAHPTMPLPSYARVTNLDNGSSMIVRVNDRGPFAHDRIIDVSNRTAEMLGFKEKGVANVKVEYVGRANIAGSDEKFLMASYRSPGSPEIAPGASQPGSMIAMASEPQSPGADAFAAQADGVLLAFVPVPTPRPAYYIEGTPLDLFGQNLALMRTPSLALGFAAEDSGYRRIEAAFDTVDNAAEAAPPMAEPVDAEAAARAAIVSLGIFRDPDAADYVRKLFADIGVVSIRQTTQDNSVAWETTMLTGSDVAGKVVELALARGLSAARIVQDGGN